jgi:hypothetical protein
MGDASSRHFEGRAQGGPLTSHLTASLPYRQPAYLPTAQPDNPSILGPAPLPNATFDGLTA